MSDGKTSVDEQGAAPGEATVEAPAVSADPGDDRLATIRVASLPPVPRPPPPSRAPRAAPTAPAPPSLNGGASDSAGAVPRGDWRLAPGKTSWLQSLLAATLPPPGTQGIAGSEGASRGPLPWVCAALAVVLIVSALIIGLGAPPTETLLSSNIVAAVVIARALMALGMLATGLTLLRMSERWLTAGRAQHRD